MQSPSLRPNDPNDPNDPHDVSDPNDSNDSTRPAHVNRPHGRAGRRRFRPAAAVLTVLVAVFLAAAATAPRDRPPRTTASGDGPGMAHLLWERAFVASTEHPDAPPPGADDWTCEPRSRHPRPVVLVHGTYENAYNNWSALAPLLRADGYCVFAPNLGAPPGDVIKGRSAVPRSARELARFVDRVLDRTGARQADLVGHSQGGGILPRYYLRFAGGTDAADPARNKVSHLIGIAPANHGSTVSGLATLAQRLRILAPAARFGGQALADQTIGSAVNTRLDEGGDTLPGVRYTTVVTRRDRIVTPFERQYLRPARPADRVTNITVQDICPQDRTGHMGSPYDPVVLRLVRNALDPATARRPDCASAF
ncbi:esterase/lipase family protein [Streptomyces sp. OR43]|uniref:esterase/lipase family protein n=1 Tax=Streptomyces sp. or43 TaxID=2478957 RepID=UPI0011CE65D1|nr:alpha/beta fold hydrolase [Streptomyces sp. or43]TXS47104.1 alpha/beta fold hydrolase [Streptomyces sp. or43]